MNLETMNFELQENGIGTLTLNRPEKLNAISFQMVEDFHKILDSLMVNLDCRILILKGAGRAFCTGLDLGEMEYLISTKLPENANKYFYLQAPEFMKRRLYYQHSMSQIILKMRTIPQPIISLIQGPAIGGGFTFAMASDMRYAGPNAKFGIGSINVGMSGGDLGGAYFLPRQIGLALAGELMLTGRFLEAQEAERVGFVLKVVEDSKLMDIAMDMAKVMLKKSPLGIRMTKEVINVCWDAPSLQSIVHFDNRAQIICGCSKDLKEINKANAEKRKPEFPLR